MIYDVSYDPYLWFMMWFRVLMDFTFVDFGGVRDDDALYDIFYVFCDVFYDLLVIYRANLW